MNSLPKKHPSAVQGAGVDGDFNAGQCPYSDATKSNRDKAASRAKVDHALVDRSFRTHDLSKSFAIRGVHSTFFLPCLPHIVTNLKGRDCAQLRWFDPKSGAEGTGAISLVVHVMKITPDEAAFLLASFMSTKHGISFNAFVTEGE